MPTASGTGHRPRDSWFALRGTALILLVGSAMGCAVGPGQVSDASNLHEGPPARALPGQVPSSGVLQRVLDQAKGRNEQELAALCEELTPRDFRRLAEILETGDIEARVGVCRIAENLGPRAACLVPGLIGTGESAFSLGIRNQANGPGLLENVCAGLAAIGRSGSCAVPALAHWFALTFGVERTEDGEEWGSARFAACSAVLAVGEPEEAAPLILRLMSSSGMTDRYNGAAVAGMVPVEGSSIRGALCRSLVGLLLDPDPRVRAEAARSIQGYDVDAEVASSALLAMVNTLGLEDGGYDPPYREDVFFQAESLAKVTHGAKSDLGARLVALLGDLSSVRRARAALVLRWLDVGGSSVEAAARQRVALEPEAFARDALEELIASLHQ